MTLADDVDGVYLASYVGWQKSLGSSFGLAPNTTPGLAAGRVRQLRVSENSRQWRDAVPHVSLAVGRRAQGCIRRADCITTTSINSIIG
jgi:hypothetical protein